MMPMTTNWLLVKPVIKVVSFWGIWSMGMP